MIDPVIGLFEIRQYSDKKSITIDNLVETMRMVRYPWALEITYDQGGEFLGHKF